MKKIISLLFIVLLFGCGASKKSDFVSTENSFDYKNEIGFDSSAMTSGEETKANLENRKLIKNYTLNLQTKTFEVVINEINRMVNEIGGYVQSSSIDGENYYYENRNRYASLTIKIPANHVDQFLYSIENSENIKINSRSENIQDVTEVYTDVEARIDTLKMEEETLKKLLEKAEKLEDVLTIESKLSSVRYEIESYERQKKNYDLQIDYASVYIYVNEVERITYQEPTFIDRIKNAFMDSVDSIANGFVDIIVFVLGNILYFIILGILVLFIRKLSLYAKIRANFRRKEKIIVDNDK